MAIKSKQRSKATTFVVTVLLYSLAFPVMYFLNNFEQAKQPLSLFLVGSAVCIAFFVASKLILHNTISGLLCFFGFTTVIDVILGLTAAKTWINWGEFYLVFGEPYLGTSLGCWACLHDSTVHLSLYLFLGVCHTNSANLNQSLSQRYAALFWFGSMMNSLHVLFPGVFCGSLGATTELSILFNVPFFLFPVWYGVKTFFGQPSSSFYRPSPAKIIDTVCFLFYLLLPLLSFLRLFAAMESPYPHAIWWRENVEPILTNAHKFPLMQMIVNVYWGIPLSFMLSFCHYYGEKMTKYWVADLASVVAGAAIQAQSVFIGAAMMKEAMVPTPGFQPIPKGFEGNIFWAVNISLIVFPLLSLFRFCFWTQSPLSKRR